MKKFISGFLCSALLYTLTISALAISGHMTIEVDPINIQVNGVTFKPADVNGNEVPVFAYNGTTYAPLRALAEAYGLEVGYDSEKNMATVKEHKSNDLVSTQSSKMTYQEFKGLWADVSDTKTGRAARYVYTGTDSRADLVALLQGIDTETLGAWTWSMMEELCAQRQLEPLGADLYFYYNDTNTENRILYSNCMGGIGQNGYGSISWS